MDLLHGNTAALAFIGDAAYELYVRRHVMGLGLSHADRLHAAATRYVRASAQAGAVKLMYDGLPEGEQALVRRARNRKTANKPRNADPAEYKWATAFEALLGYYCASGQEDRLREAAETAIGIIDGMK
ncbi:MAG: ribonuclease III [Clostridiales Family XIII bacterium]|nr:ribonuclease III [Clostridiales Family XIII bacterium]